MHQIGFDWELSFTDALVTQLIVALAGYTINSSMHSYLPSARNSLYVLSWSIALAALCVILQREALLQLTDAQETYRSFLDNSLLIRGTFAWLMIMLIAVLTWFWVYVTDHQESENRKHRTHTRRRIPARCVRRSSRLTRHAIRRVNAARARLRRAARHRV